jgi:hypothetical protein
VTVLQSAVPVDPFAWPTLIAVIAAGLGAIVAAAVSVYSLFSRTARVKWKAQFGRELFKGGAISVRVTNLGKMTARDALGSFRLMNGQTKSTYVRVAPPNDLAQNEFVESTLSPHDHKDLWAAVDWTWRTADGEKHERIFKWRPNVRDDQLLVLANTKRALRRYNKDKRDQNTPPRRSLRDLVSRR